MNNLNIIVARGKNSEIGRDNTLIWHLPDDLKFFKEKTKGKTIVMGYNTFKSLPKMLKERKHIILTHRDIENKDVLVYHSKEDLLNYLNTIDDEVFIIGGASIYKQFIDDVDTMYITEIDSNFDADAFFPDFELKNWNKEILGKNNNNNLEFKFIKYTRKNDKVRGKLIVIEGTDCSGKETQTNKIIEKLNKEEIKIVKYCYPNYDSPTGKIVGGPYLGKSYICEGWFKEGAINVDPKVASLYYAADRRYDMNNIDNKLNEGYNVILDRYVYSNMGHQGGKIHDKKERNKMYKWLEKLEFDLLELPKPDIRIFLHMPYDAALKLRIGREEEADQHELSKDHLIHAEKSYLEIAKKYKFKTIECTNGETIKTIDEINDEIYTFIKEELENL